MSDKQPSSVNELELQLERQLTSQKMTSWGPAVIADIKKLVADIAPANKPFENADIITEIIVTALKAVQSNIGRGDMKLLSRSLRELRYAFKIFKSYREIRKVTIFGSARTKPSHPEYKLTHDFAKKIRQKGYMIITGAGPGVMAAGNEGAGPNGSFGVNIKLPFEQHPNEFIANQSTYIDCRYFFTRKLVFVKEASAAAFFPGGFGTLDEAFELLTLVQTGKCDPIPILFLDTPKGHYWSSAAEWIKKNMLPSKKISKEDLSLFRIARTAEEAVEEITGFYSNYHSIRYVGPLLVVRLQKYLEDSQLQHLNKNFSDIVVSGKFQRSAALPEEENQPELAHLPRLVFRFNRINNGRLRQMIDFLNRS
jgi:uncharacterized protein (TIGR00730 family)